MGVSPISPILILDDLDLAVFTLSLLFFFCISCRAMSLIYKQYSNCLYDLTCSSSDHQTNKHKHKHKRQNGNNLKATVKGRKQRRFLLSFCSYIAIAIAIAIDLVAIAIATKSFSSYSFLS
jgi:hypothetical protein